MIIIGNGTLVANTPAHAVVPNGAVAVEGGRIAAVGDAAELRAAHPGHEFVDAGGALIMPGFVNVHHHFYSALARGMTTSNPRTSRNFMEILENLWWRLDEALTPEDVRVSAELSLADSIKCGVTTIVDHHAGFGAIAGSLDAIAEAARRFGARTCLCFEVSDRRGKEAARESIAENRRFLESLRGRQDGMVAGLFGLHASFTLSDDTLAGSKEAAGDAGFHVHVAEGKDDAEDALAKHGMTVVKRLRKFGVLGKRSLAVHCIHVEADDMDVLAESGTAVVHNPQSNMSNAVGCSPLLELLRRGVRVGVGTDGYSHDVLESAKAAGLLQRHQTGDPSVAWAEPYALLRDNNPAFASAMFGVRLGVLEPGAAADVVVVDYDPPTPLAPGNIAAHLHFGLYGPMVRDSMIAGKMVMRGRKLTSIDESALRAHGRERAEALWARL